ncbi:hypothetical protein HAP94_05060 [Acidithiobacillus ferrivorans]|nr:hypothetical protein [Acidithiobacillus ferrivorans]
MIAKMGNLLAKPFKAAQMRVLASWSTAWLVPQGLARKAFPLMRKKSFLRRIQIMGKAQAPFSDAISELKKRANENHEGIMFAALQAMDLRVRRGQKLAQIFQGWLTSEEIMLIEAGDKIGFPGYVAAIDKVLSMGSATAEIQGALLNGIFEPVILMASIYMLMLWMSSSFTGKLLKVTHVSPSRLTGMARQFYDVGLFAATPWSILVPIIMVLPVMLVWLSFSRWTGKRSGTEKIRAFLDRFPPYSVYKEITGAQWVLTLSMLAVAGYPYELILQELGHLSRPWAGMQTRLIERCFRKGITLGDAMRQAGGWFPSRAMVQDIMAFGERPGFKETLKVLAEESIKDTTRMVKMMANVMRGVGYLLMFIALVWLYEAFNALSTQVQTIAQATGH